MGDYTRPTYTNGYEIRYNRESDQFECWRNETLLSKKDGKPASYKALGLATKYMAACGAQEAALEPKNKLWTPPPAAKITPLSEQLAVFPADAPRFVVVEAGYGTYHEQGYAVYDRKEQKLAGGRKYSGWNSVYREKYQADENAVLLNDNPPEPVEFDLFLFNAMLSDDEKAEYPAIQPGSKEEETYKRQAAYWQERKGQNTPAPESKPIERDVIFATRERHEAGDIIHGRDGRYRVTATSYWLSERDVADLEDQDMFGAQVGWQTPATLMTEEQH